MADSSPDFVPRDRPATPRWVKAFAVAAVVLVLVVVVVMLVVGGEHGPGRHTATDDAGAQTATAGGEAAAGAAGGPAGAAEATRTLAIATRVGVPRTWSYRAGMRGRITVG